MTDTITLSRFARKRLFPKAGRTDKLQGTDPSAYESHINSHAPIKRLAG